MFGREDDKVARGSGVTPAPMGGPRGLDSAGAHTILVNGTASSTVRPDSAALTVGLEVWADSLGEGLGAWHKPDSYLD